MRLNTLLPALLLPLSFAANAEVPLTEADILGSWKIDKESLKRDAPDEVTKELNTVWVFKKDGTMVGESTDSQAHARIDKLRATVKYRVEDGKLIKQVSPGRSREEACIAEEKEGNKMVLKCSNIYFFMTKK